MHSEQVYSETPRKSVFASSLDDQKCVPRAIHWFMLIRILFPYEGFHDFAVGFPSCGALERQLHRAAFVNLFAKKGFEEKNCRVSLDFHQRFYCEPSRPECREIRVKLVKKTSTRTSIRLDRHAAPEMYN